MRNGACDYLVKPVCFEKLELPWSRCCRAERSSKEFGKDTETSSELLPHGSGRSRRARQAAATDADVLIEAESGTGKE